VPNVVKTEVERKIHAHKIIHVTPYFVEVSRRVSLNSLGLHFVVASSAIFDNRKLTEIFTYTTLLWD